MTRFVLFHLHAGKSGIERTFGTSEDTVMAMIGNTAAGIRLAEAGETTPVAVVEANTPSDLYNRTNSLDAPWTLLNPPLKGPMRLRSTSCGDIIADLETGYVLLCATVGWEEIANPLAARLLDEARRFEASTEEDGL